jgi:dTDP-glucose pyrophosphorylase
MTRWKDVVVSKDTLLKDAIAKIDASRLQVALVLGADDSLLGILTDGDVRRAILAGKELQVPVSEVMTTRPTVVSVHTPRDEMLALMRRKSFHHLPLLDDAGRVAGLATLDELIGVTARPNWVVLMAGGLGRRLSPLTDERPKPLLAVGGKPILETILESFADQGFKRLFLSVNYKADMIRSHFGDGDRWGVKVEYLSETARLGTAGALSLLPEKPTLPIVVMNADVLTRMNFDSLLQFHTAQHAVATMAVREYDFQVPYGVVRLDATHIKAIEEKPVQKFFVNAGVYALSPEALDQVPPQTFFDMPTLFERLIDARKTTAAYPLRENWLDIGRLDEFERAQTEWAKGQE